jgi:hypothetical protein
MIPVVLTLEQWQLVGNCLVEQPFKLVAPIVQELQRQVSQGIQDMQLATQTAQVRGAAPLGSNGADPDHLGTH